MLIPVERITIPTPTQEVNEEQLKDLQDSIEEKGLSHPIIVRPANDLAGYVLVSGEKRLLAYQRLGRTEIPADVREIDEHEGKEIRLHENLKRFNLPWWEQVKLVEELHNLRQEQHGLPKRTGRPPKEGDSKPKVGWSVRDTAEELRVGVGNLSEDLSLARALRHNPALKNTTDKKTALRLIRIAASRHQAEQDATAPGGLEANEIFLGDSAHILHNLPANSVNHCITDPPWINFFDDSLRIDDRTLPVFRELFRVLKHGAFLYLFCGLDDYSYYSGIDEPTEDSARKIKHKAGQLERIGFNVAKTPVIWRKINSLSRRGVSSWEYDRDFEFIIVAVKGSPALTTGRKLSSFKDHAIVHPSKMVHPNEKPTSLLEDIIEDCSYEGEIIIDPFGGSGALGVAARAKKRKYILIERDKNFYDAICARLK